MVEHITLGATYSVIINTAVLPVVPDTSYRQAISAFQLILSRVQFMSESSRAPNLFPAAGSQNNQLRTYDREVQMHPNEEVDCCRHHDAPDVTLQPTFLFKYHKWYPECFEVAHFR